MSATAETTSEVLPPHVQLIQMGTASWVSAMVAAAAQTGIADQLSAGPQSAAQLAGKMRLHAPTLHRFMRTLAGLGILTERDGQRFALTPLGEALETGAPGSARATLMSFCGPSLSRAWEQMIYSLETGKSGFTEARGMPFFEFLAKNPEQASLFSEAMVGFNGTEALAVARAYEFSGFESIVDVGGATGNMLAEILSHHAGPRGILFDRPHVVVDAPALLKARGVDDRVTIQAGDFFESVPAGADAYVMSHIVHDWNEDQCATILGHSRRAIKPDGRLLIVEMVLPDGDTPHLGKVMDMVMLVFPGGQERTEAEFASLLGKSGFKLNRVVPTASAVSVLEAIPV
jgi:O-methyltransferase domain